MEKTFTFTVNGKSRTMTTDPDRPLLEVLREDLQLTGTKYGCGEGQCRACTVLIEGRATRSCITPVSDVDQKSIVTIEGLSTGEKLHPVQEAFLEEGGYQCGYCTPGMILATVELLSARPQPTEGEILGHMEGHLCRCCGYPKVLNSIKRAAALTRKESR